MSAEHTPEDIAIDFRRKEDLEVLIKAVATAIYKLREPQHGSLAITPEAAFERARNIVAGPVALVCQDAYDSGYSEATLAQSAAMTAFANRKAAGA